jgi:hypothetical protein
MMPVNPHPLISGVCPLLSLVALAVGFAMMVIAACGFDWARKLAGLCGIGILLPLVTGVAIMYGSHWRFSAMVPVAALSADGHTYRDGCQLGAMELDAIRAGGYPTYWYRWYAVMAAIVVLGEWDNRIKRNARAKQEAEYRSRKRCQNL